MRPPAFAAPRRGDSESGSGGAPVLQSTLLSNGRRIAMIDGKPMKVGDRIGAARIVSIDPSTVTLREARKITVLQLYQGVEVTRPGAAKATHRQRREGRCEMKNTVLALLWCGDHRRLRRVGPQAACPGR